MRTQKNTLVSENNNKIIIDDFDNEDFSFNGRELLDRLTPATADSTGDMQGDNNPLAGDRFVRLIEIPKDWAPMAITFTFSTDHVYKTVSQTTYKKNGAAMVKKVNLLLIDADPENQWKYFKNIFQNGFCDKVYKKHNFCINNWQLYPEFIKAGLLHVHALIYIDAQGWAVARAHAMAEIWVKLTKGHMKSLVKTTFGKHADYAFAPCNNVDSWIDYISKEFTIHQDNLINIRI